MTGNKNTHETMAELVSQTLSGPIIRNSKGPQQRENRKWAAKQFCKCLYIYTSIYCIVKPDNLLSLLTFHILWHSDRASVLSIGGESNPDCLNSIFCHVAAVVNINIQQSNNEQETDVKHRPTYLHTFMSNTNVPRSISTLITVVYKRFNVHNIR